MTPAQGIIAVRPLGHRDRRIHMATEFLRTRARRMRATSRFLVPSLVLTSFLVVLAPARAAPPLGPKSEAPPRHPEAP